MRAWMKQRGAALLLAMTLLGGVVGVGAAVVEEEPASAQTVCSGYAYEAKAFGLATYVSVNQVHNAPNWCFRHFYAVCSDYSVHTRTVSHLSPGAIAAYPVNCPGSGYPIYWTTWWTWA